MQNQDASKIPAKMGSSERAPPACLSHNNCWARYLDNYERGPGGWGGGPGNRSILAGKSSILCEDRRMHGLRSWLARQMKLYSSKFI